MRQSSEVLFSAQDATVNPFNSNKLDCRQVYALSIIMESSSGSNGGTLVLQGSNDPCPYGNVAANFTPTNWVTIPSALVDGSGTVTSGATITLHLKQICYSWIRANWQPSGGAGTITAQVNTQGV